MNKNPLSINRVPANALIRSILFLTAMVYAQCLCAQHMFGSYPYTVFVDSAKVRSAPSLTAKVAGRLRHNNIVYQCQEMELKSDSIGGLRSSWLPMRTGGNLGYIWEPVFADAHCMSQVHPGLTFMVRFSKGKGLEFKVLDSTTLLHYSVLPTSKNYRYPGMASMGITSKSNGHEVIAINGGGEDSFDLFSWDGNTISQTDIRLNDESLITRKYLPYPLGIVNTDGVNIRSSPSRTAAIVGQANQYSRITLLKMNHTLDTTKSLKKHWHSIKWNGKEAFILSDLIDVPIRYIRSNKADDEAFLYTDHAIYAFRNDTVCDRLVHTIHDWDRDNFFGDFGSKGLEQQYQFLGVCIMSGTCGAPGGDQLFSWNGKKLKYIGFSYSANEAEFIDQHDFLFPADEGGIQNRIVKHDIISQDFNRGNCGEAEQLIGSETRRIYTFNGDSLMELPSPCLMLEKLLKQKFPAYAIRHYQSSDFNQDGFGDIVFLASRYKNDGTANHLAGMAFGTRDSGYIDAVFNAKLLSGDYQGTKILVSGDTVSFFAQRQDERAGETYYRQSENFSFIFDKPVNDFRLYSVSSDETEDTVYFKKKKILFANTTRALGRPIEDAR